MEKCSQCDKQAFARFGDNAVPLCVEHYFTLMKATYLQVSMLASQLNFVRGELEAGSGGLVKFPRMHLPPPTFVEGGLTFSTIKVSDSAIGMLNVGTVKNFKDVEFNVELMTNKGQDKLAEAVANLTRAVIESNEITMEAKDEISEQLRFITTQMNVEPEARQKGLIKGILSGLGTTISTVAGLITIWNQVEPMLRAHLGV